MTSQNTPPNTKFDNLEQTLEIFIENCRHLCVIASDFQPGMGGGGAPAPPGGGAPASSTAGSQALLNQKLQTFVQGLLELDQSKHLYQDVKIPLELLDYVDRGKNPQLYTKDIMESCLQKNNQTRGKIELYRKFRANLLKQLGEEFPEETKIYRMMRPLEEESSSSLQQQNTNVVPGQGSNVGQGSSNLMEK